MKRDHAFTLVELLVALCIVAVLASLLFLGLKSFKYTSNRAESVAVMRNIGSALSLYVAENNELPGPLFSYQAPTYSDRPFVLINHLWNYLGLTDAPRNGELVDGYVPAFWKRWYETRRPGSASIYMAHGGFNADGERIELWGYPATSSGNEEIPRPKWAFLAANLSLAQTVALSDWTTADQVTPSQKSLTVPEAGELQNCRNRLFLDWHIETSPIKPL